MAFRDLGENTIRKVGETFEVTEERLAEINGTKYGVLATPVAEAKRPVARRSRKSKEQ